MSNLISIAILLVSASRDVYASDSCRALIAQTPVGQSQLQGRLGSVAQTLGEARADLIARTLESGYAAELNNYTQSVSTSKDPNIFHSPAIYSLFDRFPHTLNAILKRSYGAQPEYKSLVGLAKALGKQHRSLLIDPEIIAHNREFISFLAKTDTSKMSTIDIRAAFSHSLGTVTLYRALNLTDLEFEDTKSNGIQPGVVRIKHDDEDTKPDRVPRKMRAALNWMFKQNTNLVGSLGTHLVSRNQSFMQSASVSPVIARAVAATYQEDDQQNRLVVFSITVPKLNVISPYDSKFFDPIHAVRVKDLKGYNIESQFVSSYNDEVFVVGSIPASSLRVITDEPGYDVKWSEVHH